MKSTELRPILWLRLGEGGSKAGLQQSSNQRDIRGFSCIETYHNNMVYNNQLAIKNNLDA